MTDDKDAKMKALQAKVAELREQRDRQWFIDHDALCRVAKERGDRAKAAESRARAAEGELRQVREAVAKAAALHERVDHPFVPHLMFEGNIVSEAREAFSECTCHRYWPCPTATVLASVPDETEQPTPSVCEEGTPPADDDSHVHHKYDVRKVNDRTGKHRDCRFFVIDPKHDEFAGAALFAYAQEARRAGNESLALDVQALIGFDHPTPPAAPHAEDGADCAACSNTEHVCSCGAWDGHNSDCNIWLNDPAPVTDPSGTGETR